jgi:hypothetical protein
MFKEGNYKMSFITVPGKDIIVVNEKSYKEGVLFDYKVHLVRLKFEDPNDDKMKWVSRVFKRTNRYVVDAEHIRYYNYYLKKTNLKYYIINTPYNWSGLISFFKKNNKVLLDFTKLSLFEKQFVLNVALEDVLANTEVILIEQDDYELFLGIFNQWKGDIIIHNEKYPI